MGFFKNSIVSKKLAVIDYCKSSAKDIYARSLHFIRAHPPNTVVGPGFTIRSLASSQSLQCQMYRRDPVSDPLSRPKDATPWDGRF